MHLDPEHKQMEIDLLKQISVKDSSLLTIQKKGWDMINALVLLDLPKSHRASFV